MNQEQFTKFVAFCARCHEGQHRKDKITPYFSHPSRVALLYLKYQQKVSYLHLSIAYGHDLIEDCIEPSELIEFLDSTTIKQSEKLILFNYILALTENKNIKPRSDRKKEYINRLISNNDNNLLIIKLCDRLDNLNDDGMTKKFLKITYLDESEELLNKINKEIGYETRIAKDLKKRICQLKEVIK